MNPKVLTITCFACLTASSPAVLAEGHSDATRDAVMGHMRAVGQKDIDAYVAGYAEDGKIVTPSRVYAGRDEIREFASDWLAEFSGPDVAVEMQSMTFEGDTAIIVFSGETADKIYELGVETFVVSNGEIVTQTYVVDVTPKE